MRSQIKFKLRKTEPTMHFIEPGEKTIPLAKEEASFLAFKRYIRKNIIFFGLVIAALLLLFRYLYSFSNYYKSEVTVSFSGIEIPEYDDQLDSRIPAFAQMKEAMNRLYTMIYSKEMFVHLINKFDLYTHYELPKSDPSNYGRVRNILKSSISFYQGTNRVLTIQVSDFKSGQISADMANEIVKKSADMNKQYITEKMEMRIQMYTRLHNEVKAQTDADIQNLKPQIDLLADVLKRYKMDNPVVAQTAFNLNEVTKNIQADIDQMSQVSRLNTWTIKALDDDMMSNVMIVMEALPGQKEHNVPMWLLAPVSFVIAFFIAIFIFNLTFRYRNYLRLLVS